MVSDTVNMDDPDSVDIIIHAMQYLSHPNSASSPFASLAFH